MDTVVLTILYDPENGYNILNWETIQEEGKNITIEGSPELIKCTYDRGFNEFHVYKRIKEWISAFGIEEYVTAFEEFINSMERALYDYIV